MDRALRIGSAIALAVGFFLAGGIGLSRTPPGARTPVVPASNAPLAPGFGAGIESTIASLQQRLRAVPEDWRASGALGLAFLQQARATADPSLYGRAEDSLRLSLDGESANFEATLGLGVLAAARHDFDSALHLAVRSFELNPYSADSLGLMGDAQLELGRYRAAARTLQRMVDLRPSVASYSRVSYYRELAGDVRGAIRAMATAVDTAGTPADAAWTGYQLGELYFGQGRLTRASRAYRRAAAADPGAVLPLSGLAKVAAARDEPERSIAILEEAVHRYPSAELVILLGDIAAASGHRDIADEQYSLVGAIQRLAATNGVDTDLELALFDADHRRRPAATVRRARAAYERRPSVHAADTLAWALYGDRRYSEAARYAGDALRLGSRSALFHFHAGMIARRLGMDAGARRHLETALEINPWFSFLHADTARLVLDRLYGAES